MWGNITKGFFGANIPIEMICFRLSDFLPTYYMRLSDLSRSYIETLTLSRDNGPLSAGHNGEERLSENRKRNDMFF